MRPALIRPLCYVMLLAAWIVDLITPQLFVAAIFFNVPIALSSLVLDERFTKILIALALAANAAAGYVNGLADGGHWDTVAISDRVVSGFSFFLVGVLSIAAQRSARRAGELAARNERAAREQRVSTALERVRSMMSGELVERAIAREAVAALEADICWFIQQPAAGPVIYRCEAGSADVDVEARRADAPVASLVQRVLDDGIAVRIEPSGALGRMVLDSLGTVDAIAAPLSDAGRAFGVLVAGRKAVTFPAGAEETVALFANGAASALAQSDLFAQLARRNDELGQANASLEERNTVIRDIVYAISHDLRTPLTAAGMTMRQALEGRYGELPPSYRAILDQSIASNDELQRLAETLLLVSKYEAGEGSQRRERVHLGTLAQNVLTELESVWRSKQLTARTEGESGEVLADPGELRRTLVNLISNAIAWTPAGGAIAVRGERAYGRVRVTVEDSGYGVPAGMRDRLFERIVGESRSGGGTGLGLYIVRRIAESHGGTVRYEPREEGGSRFTIDLPEAPARP